LAIRCRAARRREDNDKETSLVECTPYTPDDMGVAADAVRLAAVAPDKVSLLYQGDAFTAGEVARLAGHWAGRFAAAGLGKGDRLVYVGPNSPSLVIALVATAWVGAVMVPLSARVSAPEAKAVRDACAPRIALVDQSRAGLAQALGAQEDCAVFVCTASPSAAGAGFAAPARQRMAEDDLALLMYTSGSAGRPKGVMLTHGNLWWSRTNTGAATGFDPLDVTVAVAPMCHIGGLNSQALGTLAAGGTLLIRERFDPAKTLRDLTGHRQATIFGVPSMFELMAELDEFATADLSMVRAAVIAGAGIRPELIHRYDSRGLTLRASWGMTETAPAATFLPAALAQSHAGASGAPGPCTQLRLMDSATGQEVTAPGQPGELWVSGPNVTRGYWQDPEATAAAFPRPGWLRTGDIATRDAAGQYTVRGRLGDVINTGGEKVHPLEVEQVLATAPGVKEVAVIGTPDPTWGEEIVAVVVPLGTEPVTLEALRQAASLSLDHYKLPRRLRLVRSLPHTATHKIDRPALRLSLANPAST
jgi:fatty-acyl-CoA synthase